MPPDEEWVAAVLRYGLHPYGEGDDRRDERLQVGEPEARPVRCPGWIRSSQCPAPSLRDLFRGVLVGHGDASVRRRRHVFPRYFPQLVLVRVRLRCDLGCEELGYLGRGWQEWDRHELAERACWCGG